MARPTGRRAKLGLILVGLALAAIVLAAWTQTWFTLTVSGVKPIVVDGSVAAPALTALALSQLVLLGAIAIAGPFFRVVLGVIQALVGVAIVASAAVSLADPVTASAASVTKATGVAGASSIAGLVDGGVVVTAWPWVSLVAGVLLMVAAVVIVITARSWPGSSSRKYTRVVAADAERTSVDDWDSLSGGDDPTNLTR
jgi:hypothetical protein